MSNVSVIKETTIQRCTIVHVDTSEPVYESQVTNTNLC